MKDYNNYKKFNLSIKLPKVEAFLSSINDIHIITFVLVASHMALVGVWYGYNG